VEDHSLTILRHLKDIEVCEGDYVQLDLFCSGNPEPEVTWYQNDLQILNNNNRQFLKKDNKYSIKLDSCNLNDSGIYKIKFRNNFGEVISQCRLNVLPKPIKQPEPQQQQQQIQQKEEIVKETAPFFIENIKDITVNEGQDACFKCKVFGVPMPEIVWTKDGVPLVESDKIKV
jgi:hypothetical protein